MCPDTCKGCYQNTDYNRNAFGFWKFVLRDVFNITTDINSNNTFGLPEFKFDSVGYSAMSRFSKWKWSEYYIISKVLNFTYSSSTAYFSSLKSHIIFHYSNDGKTKA